MHFDIAHAAAAAVVIFIALWTLEKMGIRNSREKRGQKWDWQIFWVVFVVLSILNLVWPYK